VDSACVLWERVTSLQRVVAVGGVGTREERARMERDF
jgi:hypothetical protein